jgi:hypothetical protein
MGIRQSLTLVAATVAVLLALPGVAAASAAPAVDDLSTPSGSIAVSVTLTDGPVDGVSGDATVELACSDASVTMLTSTLSFAETTTSSTTVTGVPLGATCVGSLTDLPLPPAGWTWGTGAASEPIIVESSSSPASVSLSLPLTRLDGDLAIALGILDGPVGGLTLDDEYTVDCGGGFIETVAVHMVDAHSGAVSIDGMPDGALCTVTAMSASTASGLSEATITPSTVTVTTGSTAIVEVRRTYLAPELRAANVSVTLFGGPAAGLTGPMTVGLECDAGDYLALLTFTAGTVASLTVDGIPAGAECSARAQSLPPLPAGYSWFGAAPVEAALVTIGTEPSTVVELFGRLVRVPIVDPDPATTSGSTGVTSTPPSSGSGTVAASPAAALEPEVTPFIPIEAPTLAITGDPVPVVSQGETTGGELSPAAAVLAAIGLTLVFLGLVAGVVALRIAARHRRVRLAYA